MNNVLSKIPEGVQPVVLFSGGRTSGFMLRRLLDEFPNFRNQFITVFANTGKERNETLNFVHDVETRWTVPVVWVEYQRVPAATIPSGVFPTKRRNENLKRSSDRGEVTHWFKVVDYGSASRDGKPFDEVLEWASVLPNQGARMCSVQLKIRSAMRYLFSTGLKEYAPIIGIRKDEDHRTLQVLSSCDGFEHPQFPLCDWGITESDVMSFWKNNDFDLQLESYQGNCDLCFLKAKHKRIRIARENPELLNWWKQWEERKAQTCQGDGKFFRKGQPYTLIEQWAKEGAYAMVDPSDTDIPCSCVERGFDGKDEN